MHLLSSRCQEYIHARLLHNQRQSLLLMPLLYLGYKVSHPLHALVLVVRSLLDAVGVVLEGGVAPGVVLLLLASNAPRIKNETKKTLGSMGRERGKKIRASAMRDQHLWRQQTRCFWGFVCSAVQRSLRAMSPFRDVTLIILRYSYYYIARA